MCMCVPSSFCCCQLPTVCCLLSARCCLRCRCVRKTPAPARSYRLRHSTCICIFKLRFVCGLPLGCVYTRIAARRGCASLSRLSLSPSLSTPSLVCPFGFEFLRQPALLSLSCVPQRAANTTYPYPSPHVHISFAATCRLVGIIA